MKTFIEEYGRGIYHCDHADRCCCNSDWNQSERRDYDGNRKADDSSGNSSLCDRKSCIESKVF